MHFRFAVLILFLTACSPSVLITPHKTDVQQGNVVTEDMLDKIKPGMTKSQVRFVLGTPLISDAFHGDRWDYVYRFDKKGELTEKRRLTVVFEGDNLKTVEGTALPPSKNIAGTRPTVPIAVPVLALAPEQPRPANPPALDLKLDSDLEAVPQTTADAETAATPVPVQAQAEQPKRSFGERFLRLFGIGKNEESPPPEEQPAAVVAAKPAPVEAQVEQPKRSFGERFVRVFGIGKDKEPVPPEEKPEEQQEAEPPTNTVMTADRSPPPKRSVGERFMRLIGVKEKEGDDPAPPVTTEVNTSVPRISSLTIKQVVTQILGFEDDRDREKKAAAEDIEPGEKDTSVAQGSTWQRFKRLIGASSDQEEFSTEPIQKKQQTSPAGNTTKPEAAKTDAVKPEGTQAGENRSFWQKILDTIGLGRKKSDGPQ